LWVVRVTASRDAPDMADSYVLCWESLEEAARLRAEFAAAWGRFLDDEPYEFDLTTEPDGTGTISVRVNWRDDVVAELSSGSLVRRQPTSHPPCTSRSAPPRTSSKAASKRGLCAGYGLTRCASCAVCNPSSTSMPVGRGCR
jgi:hypothetical protein